MIDLRYHITSLVAVFLALGLGIIIGSTVVGSEGLVMEQQVLIDRMEDDFNRLRQQDFQFKKEISSLQEEVLVYQQFAEEAFPLLIKDKLRGQKILLVRTGDFDNLERLQQGLELAGASFTSVVDIHRGKMGLTELEVVFNRSVEDIWKEVGRHLVAQIEEVYADNLLNMLLDWGIMDITGPDHYLPDAVILVGGSTASQSNLVKRIDRSLVQLWQEMGIRIIGVESSTAISSYMQDYKSFGISTIDNADTSLGRVALIHVLAGQDGNFGIKQSAQALIPFLMEFDNGGS